MDILRPESIIVQFGGNLSLDVGATCYAIRSAPLGGRQVQRKMKSERLVEVGRLVPERISLVKSLILYLSDSLTSRALRNITAHWYGKYIVDFIDWCDSDGQTRNLMDPATARAAFRGYVGYLRHRVDTNQITVNTAATRQLSLLKSLSDWLGVDDLHHGINLLQISKRARQPTEPPSEDEQGKVLALGQSVFKGFSDLCVNSRAFPFRLPVPGYLKYPGDMLWIFPNSPWCMTPEDLRKRESKKYGVWMVDYADGKLANPVDIAHRYADQPGKMTQLGVAKRCVEFAAGLLRRANRDAHDVRRKYLGIVAHNAFVVLFLANTGMNLSTLMELQWSGSYDVVVERQGFRSIKYRASGKPVSFEIQSTFMPLFRDFLKLREYMLNGSECVYLFFTLGAHYSSPGRLNPGCLKQGYAALRKIDTKLPRLMSKRWRAAKSDWLLRHADLETAAVVLQNDKSTVRRNYAEGSPTAHEREITRFLDDLHETVLERREDVEGGLEGPVGACRSFGNPRIKGAAPIVPDCSTPEGCLFCDKYRVHADERDIRKLLSCKYCIAQTAHMAESEEQFQALFGLIFSRIDALLGEIDKRTPDLVSRIAVEVERGELDPYWSRKFEMLVDLGLLL